MIILNVGKRGSGKTTLTKSQIYTFISNGYRNIYIFDVNGEYRELNTLDKIPTKEEFTKMANSVENSVIVFEEATIYLNSRHYDNDVLNMLVRARHSQNVFILNFHTLKSIPAYITSLINIMNLLPTIETMNEIKEKFKYEEKIITHFESVRKNKNKTETVSVYGEKRTISYFETIDFEEDV